MPDDSFYYLKIAENIHEGHGSVFSAGEPTNGYHPLWMGLLVLVLHILNPGKNTFILTVLLISVFLNLITAGLIKRFAAELGFPKKQQTLGMAIYLFMPWLVLLNLSGLETPLFFLCLISFFILLQKIMASEHDRFRDYIILGVAAGSLFLVRTDSVFFIITGSAVLLWRRRSLGSFRGILTTGAVTALISAPWLIWCWDRFGSPVQSSGLALSYMRWHTMYPIDTIEFWVLNGGRLFHKLAILFMSPFVYHAENYDTIIPIWSDVLMLLIVAGTVMYMFKQRRKTIFPSYIWLPAVFLLFFYTFVRIASAVWHMASFALVLLMVLMNISMLLKRCKLSIPVVILACLILNFYTLGNGFYYPAQGNSLIENEWALTDVSDGVLRIGATDSGYLGYFSEHIVINLDGVVNHRAFEHIRDGTFGEYLYELDLDRLLITQERLEFYCRNGVLYQHSSGNTFSN